MLLAQFLVASIAVATLNFLPPAHAQVKDLPTARPESVGMSSERLARLSAKLRADIDAKQIPGAVLLVARQGKVVQYEALGKLDAASDVPMTKDGIFRIYSMTKPITSVVAMMLVEEGRLKLDDPVSRYIPSYAKVQVGVEKPGADGKPTLELVPVRRAVTVQDLLRHTSGLTYGFFGSSLVKTAYVNGGLNDDLDNAQFADRLAGLPLHYQPCSTWDYSYSTDVLGRVIEVVTGKTLYQAMREKLFDPLGMPETAFYLTDRSKFPRIAEPLADDRQFGVNAFISDPRVARKLESGGGGLVSTAMEYARFAQMLANGGTLDGRRYLSPKTLAFMASDHLGTAVAKTPLYLPGPGYGFGLGFGVRTATGEAAVPADVGTFYWGGAGGTYFWVDPKNELVAVLMLQSPKWRTHYRALMHNMVTAAIER